MGVQFYMDVHVPWAITEQLRRLNVDVVTAQDDDRTAVPDAELLARSTELNRVLVTQDLGLRALGEAWQRGGRQFSGILYGHQWAGSIGEYVSCLMLIARASEQHEWHNVVYYIPW